MRYVDALPDNLLSVYDYDQNLLIIARTIFDTLPKREQEAVLRTHEPALTIAPLDRAA